MDSFREKKSPIFGEYVKFYVSWNFQEMFPELGDDECSLLRLKNHTPLEGQPPLKKQFIFFRNFIDRYLCNSERILQDFKQLVY